MENGSVKTLGCPDEAELAGVIPLATLGPEPLAEDFTLERLRATIAGRRGPIKAVLLDQ